MFTVCWKRGSYSLTLDQLIDSRFTLAGEQSLVPSSSAVPSAEGKCLNFCDMVESGWSVLLSFVFVFCSLFVLVVVFDRVSG